MDQSAGRLCHPRD